MVVDTLEKGEEDVVTFKVECREVDEDLTSPNANRKGVFSHHGRIHMVSNLSKK